MKSFTVSISSCLLLHHTYTNLLLLFLLLLLPPFGESYTPHHDHRYYYNDATSDELNDIEKHPFEEEPVATADPQALYKYEYQVNSPHTGDYKSQHEERIGDTVRGSYSLIEPDGSKRIVEYTADSLNGFRATVKREPPPPVAATLPGPPELPLPPPPSTPTPSRISNYVKRVPTAEPLPIVTQPPVVKPYKAKYLKKLFYAYPQPLYVHAGYTRPQLPITSTTVAPSPQSNAGKYRYYPLIRLHGWPFAH